MSMDHFGKPISPTEASSQELLLALPQLAKLSNESLAVWRKRVSRRQIPFVKCGRNVRVRREDYQSWIQRRTVPAVERA